ncbi:MAG TPA: EAL domain-containing protein [Polyangiaceae bacterium]|nr:EAL domain-containing protein [Polyangiaceae bacterium]
MDDEPNVRLAFRRLLLRDGIETDVAESGAEALELARDSRYSVVVTDLAMPGMGGTLLVQHLKLVQPDATFIAVTGLKHFDPEYRKALEDEQLKVFHKPWDEDRLIAEIRKSLETNAARDMMRQAPQNDRTALSVLLVDSHDDASAFRRRMAAAERPSFLIEHCGTFSRALELAETHRFDIVVVDPDLPDSNGLEAVLLLQRSLPTVPILVFTSTDDDALAIKAVQVGAQDFLVKGQTDDGLLRRAIRYSIERKQSEQRLMRMALYDQLTGLANRSLFRQRLAHAVARTRRTSESFAVMLLDLDRFKQVNDALGHNAGDVLLQKVAATLQMAVRESDTVARIGGDEFAILCEPVVSQSEVSVIVSRILSAISEPYDLGEDEVGVTTSIGVALHPDTGDSVDGLLKAADAAMYVAKEQGRNGFHVLSRREPDAGRARLRLEKALRNAVHNRELTLYYQPQVTPSGDLIGAEALLRWDRTTISKPMPTSSLVAMLEDSGLMNSVGDWVVHEACIQFCRWNGLVDRMSVNLSARQLAHAGFEEQVLSVLLETGMDPSQLELEITESMLMRNGGRSEQALRRLRAAGVRISLDDFGTGYSSLSYLRRFPIDTVKIDQSFVADLPDDESAQSVVRAIVAMGHNLGVTVVAEGVETAEQQGFLADAGCDLMQGFFDGPPAPPNSEEWRRRATPLPAAMHAVR